MDLFIVVFSDGSQSDPMDGESARVHASEFSGIIEQIDFSPNWRDCPSMAEMAGLLDE